MHRHKNRMLIEVLDEHQLTAMLTSTQASPLSALTILYETICDRATHNLCTETHNRELSCNCAAVQHGCGRTADAYLHLLLYQRVVKLPANQALYSIDSVLGICYSLLHTYTPIRSEYLHWHADSITGLQMPLVTSALSNA